MNSVTFTGQKNCWFSKDFQFASTELTLENKDEAKNFLF